MTSVSTFISTRSCACSTTTAGTCLHAPQAEQCPHIRYLAITGKRWQVRYFLSTEIQRLLKLLMLALVPTQGRPSPPQTPARLEATGRAMLILFAYLGLFRLRAGGRSLNLRAWSIRPGVRCVRLSAHAVFLSSLRVGRVLTKAGENRACVRNGGS